MKTTRMFVGTIVGGFLSAACFASISWIVIFNSNPRFGVPGPHPEWAYLAAVLGGTMGLILGLPLGFAIGLLNRGTVLSTFLGLFASLVSIELGSESF
jgi:hypothetical protein